MYPFDLMAWRALQKLKVSNQFLGLLNKGWEFWILYKTELVVNPQKIIFSIQLIYLTLPRGLVGSFFLRLGYFVISIKSIKFWKQNFVWENNQNFRFGFTQFFLFDAAQNPQKSTFLKNIPTD